MFRKIKFINRGYTIFWKTFSLIAKKIVGQNFGVSQRCWFQKHYRNYRRLCFGQFLVLNERTARLSVVHKVHWLKLRPSFRQITKKNKCKRGYSCSTGADKNCRNGGNVYFQILHLCWRNVICLKKWRIWNCFGFCMTWEILKILNCAKNTKIALYISEMQETMEIKTYFKDDDFSYPSKRDFFAAFQFSPAVDTLKHFWNLTTKLIKKFLQLTGNQKTFTLSSFSIL